MRLLHITATHLNLMGGIPVVLRDLVNAQNRIDGFEARVLSIKADTAEMCSEYFDRLKGNRFDDYIEDYKPDVVIFHSHYYFEYIKLYKYLIKRKIPYFIEPHGSFGRAALQKSKYRKIIANRIILHSFMKNAKGYIFLNESEKADAQFKTSNDLVIPNGIKELEASKEIVSRAKWFFYFIGRFDVNHKGLDCMFDALDILENEGFSINLHLYGKGTEEDSDYVNSRIKKYNIIKVVNCGPIYGNEQSAILEQCGIMLLTSRYEGFPMTILEAWRYGNPCIVTPGTNVANEVSENRLGWRTEFDKQSISESIKKASQEYSSSKDEYVDRCKTYVSQHYSWNTIAELSLLHLSR